MTSDEIRKVREVADIVLGRFGCHRADCRDCAKFVFSLVGTDGELPVTEEWILDYWGGKHLPRTHVNNLESYQVGILTMQDFEDGKRFCANVGDEHLAIITNRYQFRLLAAALGIPKKGK